MKEEKRIMKDDEDSATDSSDKENDNDTDKSKDVGANKKTINEAVVKPPKKRNRRLVKIKLYRFVMYFHYNN